MDRRLALTGINANEVYYISFPKNLLVFLKYDFTIFMERSIDLCRLYIKTGEYHSEEVAEIRNSITGCHKYIEQNIRGVFEKLVIDCWIEYICRQNEIGVVTLWNNFIPCRNDFEKTVFSRLCEYRHNYAINQWVNLLKIQEYAVCKSDFVFGTTAKNPQIAAARANYFDLMFNVTANELGFDLSGIAENKVFNIGRVPNSPLVMRNISREIVRNVLSDIKYLGDEKFKAKKGAFAADQTAMDAFSAIKTYIPSEDDNIVGTMIKSMTEVPQKVFMPTGLKAVIDLEIDSLIESGAVLQRCNRCREYFMRDSGYNYDYCNRVSREGRSCLDIMSEKEGIETLTKGTKKLDSTEIAARCDRLYKEMSARVNVDISQRDFTDWYKYLMLIRENVTNGTASMEDFENFEMYSLSINFNQQKNNTQNGKFIPENKNEHDYNNKDTRNEYGGFQFPQPQPQSEQAVNKFNPFRINKQAQPLQPERSNQPVYPSYASVGNNQERRGYSDNSNNIESKRNNTKEVKPFVFERVESQEVQFRPQSNRNRETFQPAPSVTSKVIRAVPDSQFQSSVTIPYNTNFDTPDIKPVKINTVSENNADYNFQEQDEDVKIYDIDIVKVFEPGRSKKPVAKINTEYNSNNKNYSEFGEQTKRQPRINPVKTAAKRLEIPEYGNKKKLNEHEASENTTEQRAGFSTQPEQYTPASQSTNSTQDSKKQHAVSAYRQTGVQQAAHEDLNIPEHITPDIFNADSTQRESYNKTNTENYENESGQKQDKGGNLWETSEIRKILENNNFMRNENSEGYSESPRKNSREPFIANPILNKAIEQTLEIDIKGNTDFEGILKGLERKDGFYDEKIPTDSEGIPVTHKTKRVMDAIFKPSKPSVFFNINKNNDE